MTQTSAVEQQAAPAKYELTDETTKSWDGRTLHRIRALVATAAIGVSAGDLGGFIEAKANLEQSGNAWVFGDAQVSGNARVFGNARVSGNARVFGNAQVSGNARVFGNAQVSGNARVFGNALVFGNARVSGDAQVSGDAWVSGNARVSGDAQVSGDASIELSIHLGWHSHVGSENGTLTWFRNKDNGISVNRGCFFGDLEQFRSAVAKTHGSNNSSEEYALLIKFIELRSKRWVSAQKEAA